MAPRLIIDGYNLIASGTGGGLDDIEERRDALIEGLSVYRRLRRVKVTVVFDGTHSGNLTGGSENRGGVRVLFSREGQEADTVIKALVRETGSGLT
ncbi:MAG: NYN domain-containing protein, partial [Thermodesulfobacteriota bacterium]